MVIFQGANLHRSVEKKKLLSCGFWEGSELAVLVLFSIVLCSQFLALRTPHRIEAIYANIFRVSRTSEKRSIQIAKKFCARQGQRCYSTAKIAIKADGWRNLT